MGSTVSAVKRVQFRLRAEDKGLLQLAASYEGESLSAFNRKAELEAACSVIERNERFVLGYSPLGTIFDRMLGAD